MTRARLSRTELELLRDCAEMVCNDEPDPYTERWNIGFSIFCLHSTMFESLARKLEPLIPAKRTWVKRREEQFLVFTCTRDGTRSLVRSLLQEAGKQMRRRARLAKAEGHHLPKHYRVLWEIQDGKCYFSGARLGLRFEDREFSVDHLVPLAEKSWPYAGIPGTNWPTNLALVTKRVNLMKGSDDAATFVWQLKHRPKLYTKTFKPTSHRERMRIDRLRHERFADYIFNTTASLEL